MNENYAVYRRRTSPHFTAVMLKSSHFDNTVSRCIIFKWTIFSGQAMCLGPLLHRVRGQYKWWVHVEHHKTKMQRQNPLKLLGAKIQEHKVLSNGAIAQPVPVTKKTDGASHKEIMVQWQAKVAGSTRVLANTFGSRATDGMHIAHLTVQTAGHNKFEDTFTGEFCSTHPQDTFKKTRITLVFTHELLAALKKRISWGTGPWTCM